MREKEGGERGREGGGGGGGGGRKGDRQMHVINKSLMYCMSINQCMMLPKAFNYRVGPNTFDTVMIAAKLY